MRNSNETHHIIVAEESPIIREGLLQMLCHLNAVHVHVVAVSTMHSLDDMLNVRSFHLVFVSPAFGQQFDVQDFKLRHPGIPCVAIVSAVDQLAQVPLYAGFITIHSTIEEVEQVIISSRESTQRIAETRRAAAPSLSVREREILVSLAKGRTSKEIAEDLNIAVYTVNTHRRNICQKLDIHSAAGLTVYAIANGLVDM